VTKLFGNVRINYFSLHPVGLLIDFQVITHTLSLWRLQRRVTAEIH